MWRRWRRPSASPRRSIARLVRWYRIQRVFIPLTKSWKTIPSGQSRLRPLECKVENRAQSISEPRYCVADFWGSLGSRGAVFISYSAAGGDDRAGEKPAAQGSDCGYEGGLSGCSRSSFLPHARSEE